MLRAPIAKVAAPCSRGKVVPKLLRGKAPRLPGAAPPPDPVVSELCTALSLTLRSLQEVALKLQKVVDDNNNKR